MRTFCLTYAGLYRLPNLKSAKADPESIDLSAKAITFRTLKQGDKVRYRSLPCPDMLLDALELAHS